jgi:HD-like signal output (HDOD) protein
LSKDPVLTADLLKIVNSAYFGQEKRVDNIFRAITLVGLRNIRNLLFSYGTKRILGDDSPEKKRLWEHSFKTAFYAYNLARNFKRDFYLQNDAYVGGMLHDMGQIVFSSVRPDLMEKIQDFCTRRNIANTPLEYLSVGMNYAEIGSLIAEKWNFPYSLISAIRYHSDPGSADEQCRDLVECVYLANLLSEYENNNAVFGEFDQNVLANFNIHSQSHLDGLLERLSHGFQKDKENVS